MPHQKVYEQEAAVPYQKAAAVPYQERRNKSLALGGPLQRTLATNFKGEGWAHGPIHSGDACA